MPKFEVATPDGKKFEIEAPDAQSASDTLDEFLASQGGPATAPSGLRPGTPEYAAWAGEQARAGAKLPQVSDPRFTETQSSILDPFVQGTTFGFADEMRGAVQGGLAAAQGGDFGSTYNQVVDESRNALDREREVNPWGSVAAEVAGAIPTGMVAGGQLAGKGATLLGRVGTGALVGGAQGGVYGAGAANGDLEDRAKGAAFGGATGAAIGGAIPVVEQGFKALFGRVGAVMPEIDDLYQNKNNAYAAVDKSGFRYSAAQYDDLVNDIYRRVGADNIDPNRDGAHKLAISMLDRLNNRSAPMSLGELDQLRQVIRRDVIDAGSKPDMHFGELMLDAIDDFIAKAGGSEVIGAARSAHQTLRKSELLADAVEKAYLNASSSGSGGNIDNALRQQIKQILTNPSKARGFTAAELAAMKKIVEGGGSVQGLLRLVGKLSPSGNGLMAALGLGATAMNPTMAVPVGVGLAAKGLADNATKGGVQALQRSVRMGAGGIPPLPPIPSPGLLQRGAAPLVPYLGGRVGESVTPSTGPWLGKF